ncbi:MAG: lipoate--protein ligase family protein, partial [Propionibacteriaceae bacterium]|nr:lipoate--protein ligase family protein [Propionibacteriaceae bacterium]
MRGEYKAAGGKLVAAEVRLADQRLSQVRLSGDFFLEPEEALTRMEQALVGAEAEASVTELTHRLEAALQPSDVLVGLSPTGAAIAVRRALGQSSTWSDHQFSLIVDGPREPHTQMALDQVYAEELAAGRRGPTLRFWDWADNAV